MVSKKIEVFSGKCIVLELPAYNLQKLYIYILLSVTDNQNLYLTSCEHRPHIAKLPMPSCTQLHGSIIWWIQYV